MTILAPGALDLDTIRGISQRDHRADRHSFAVHHRVDWSKVRLPHASELTVFHPTFGVAWLDWSEEEIPTGSSLPGRLTLRAKNGVKLTGSVLLSPGWQARGGITTFSSEPSKYRCPVTGVAELELGGLPPGRYELSGEVNGKRVRKTVRIKGEPVVLDPR